MYLLNSRLKLETIKIEFNDLEDKHVQWRCKLEITELKAILGRLISFYLTVGILTGISFVQFLLHGLHQDLSAASRVRTYAGRSH